MNGKNRTVRLTGDILSALLSSPLESFSGEQELTVEYSNERKQARNLQRNASDVSNVRMGAST